MTGRARLLPWALLMIAAAAAASVLLQLRLLHPFRPQTLWGLRAGAFLRDAAPPLTLVALAAVALGAALTWRRVGLRGRLARGAVVVVAAGAAVLARVNVFELMFSPLPEPTFVAAGDAGFLTDDDMVLAVVVLGEAVAYPVRLLAHHHLVHDTVSGRHLVATY